jgi:hypothetical protein
MEKKRRELPAGEVNRTINMGNDTRKVNRKSREK